MTGTKKVKFVGRANGTELIMDGKYLGMIFKSSDGFEIIINNTHHPVTSYSKIGQARIDAKYEPSEGQ